MSLVEQAIAKLRASAGAEQQAQAPGSRGPMARVMTPVAEDLSTTARTNKVLAIDTAAMRANGYLPEPLVERQFAEHYRQIKRPLIERAQSANGRDGETDARIIMITSALPGEGKTFTSINLAFSLARERDVSVLLVDSDIPKPHISDIFGIRQQPGLMDALLDENVAVESLIMDTNVKGLSVLPAGRASEGAAELLVSNRMRQILRSLVNENPRRIVLFDSSPLLATSEGRALITLAGQFVLVVRAGQTPQSAVRDSMVHIGPAKKGGIVINDARLSLTESFYGYGAYGRSSDGDTTQS